MSRGRNLLLKTLVGGALSFLLASCQMSSGTVGKLSNVPCRSITAAEAYVNWAMFGTSRSVKRCNDGRSSREAHEFDKGYAQRQKAAEFGTYLYDTNERNFRELLASTGSGPFASIAQTIAIKHQTRSRKSIYLAITENAGGYAAFFTATRGFVTQGGVDEVYLGSISSPAGMSRDEFEEWILDNLAIVDTDKGQAATVNPQKSLDLPFQKPSNSLGEGADYKRDFSKNTLYSLCTTTTSMNNGVRVWSNSKLEVIAEMRREIEARNLGLNDCSVELRDSGVVAPAPSNGKSVKQQQPQSEMSTRPIAISWQGRFEMMAGTISYTKNADSGDIRFDPPDGSGRCNGTFVLADKSKGVWSVSCPSNVSASGAFEMTKVGGRGVGKDTKNNQIQFSLGSEPVR